jgi:hypothetical protein
MEVTAMAVKLVNLTPHPVTIRVGETELTIPPSGRVARVKEEVITVGEIEVDGVKIPLRTKKLSEEVEDLPQPEEGVIYIVSFLAAQAAWAMGRRDVVATGDPVRDEQGRIIAISSLYVSP